MNILDINTDSYFYNYLNSLDNSICCLEPNHITIFNYFISALLLYFTYNKTFNIYILSLIILIRALLDNLDGGIARKCNKTSVLGKYLDVFGDTISAIIFFIVLYINIKDEYIWIRNIIPLFIISYIYAGYSCIYNDYEIYNSKLGRFIHDNTTIINVIGYYIIYSLLK